MGSRFKKQLLAPAWMAAAVVADSGAGTTVEPGARDILDLERGAVVLRHTGQGLMNCPEEYCYPVIATLDGTLDEYWISPGGRPFPHRWIIELDRTYRIHTLVVDNTEADEQRYPGISAKDVHFYGSADSPTSGYTKLALVEANQGDRKAVKVEARSPVRWLKVEVLSNHGDKELTQMMELEAYGEAVGPLPKQPDPSGVYRTNYGPTKIRVDGNRVTGCYDMGNGHVWGETNGRVMLLKWSHNEEAHFGDSIMVAASSGNYINGMWYEEIFKGVWFGNRAARDLESSCVIDPDYPGEDVVFERKKSKRHSLPVRKLMPR